VPVSEDSSILVRLKNCTDEEEENVSTLLVNGVRHIVASSDQGMIVPSLDTVDTAVRKAFKNIKHGK